MTEVETIVAVDSKRAAILTASFEVFSAYGFKRTSMKDIANAAGVSRPALYQIFSNKADIFKALFEQHMDETCAGLKATESQPTSIIERLQQIIDEVVLKPHRMLEALPHGNEILGLKSEIVPDLSQQWSHLLHQQFENALSSRTELSPQRVADLAMMLSVTIDGFKARGYSADVMEAGLAQILRVIALAIAD